jgi:hypothetical protein
MSVRGIANVPSVGGPGLMSDISWVWAPRRGEGIYGATQVVLRFDMLIAARYWQAPRRLGFEQPDEVQRRGQP